MNKGRTSRLARCKDQVFYLSPTTDRRVTGGYDIRAERGNAVVARAFTLPHARMVIRNHLKAPNAAVVFEGA
jgi:hypothetical protein